MYLYRVQRLDGTLYEVTEELFRDICFGVRTWCIWGMQVLDCNVHINSAGNTMVLDPAVDFKHVVQHLCTYSATSSITLHTHLSTAYITSQLCEGCRTARLECLLYQDVECLQY